MERCPACAHENPDDQKFCGECGAQLLRSVVTDDLDSRGPSYTPPHLTKEVLTSRFALEGERKLVTVLFCDIANSTPLAARVGAEAMHGLISRFFEMALAEVHRFDGTINQFLGDGFMALFGAPVSHEDHARRALLTATAILQRQRVSSGDAGALGDIQLRMGLNTGMVVVGKIGDNLRMDYTAIGETTNLAARLLEFAAPGTIRTSEATRRAARTHFEFKYLGSHALKGIADPVAIFEPLGGRSASEVGAHQQPGSVGSVIVGREPERAALSRSLKDLASGRGGVVLIRGEPGAGKSRLVTEATRHEDARDVLWLEGRSVSFGRGLSYWPFIEILKGAFEIEESDAEAEALRKLEAGVRTLFDARAAEIVPYLATVMSLGLTGDYEQRVKFLDAQAMKRQVFLSMRQLFERLARRQPMLIVMEDWHWVDQSSIALCEHLLPLAQSQPTTFWLTTRAEPAEPAARIKAATAANASLRVEELVLAPLEQEHCHTLIDNLVGNLPESVRGQIQRRTEGNPFFIEEVIRALIADGMLIKDSREGGWRLARPVIDLAIPDTIQGVIVARIDRLEDSVKGVIKLASVIGRSFFLRILKAIAGATDNVEQGLGKLEQNELIRLRQQAPEYEYIFKHALVQEAAYGGILAERRRALHRRVAQAIEALFVDRLEEFSSLLAYHYALAEQWDKAQAYLFKAGDQAGRMAADAEALEHYRQAEATFMNVAARELTPLQRATMERKLGQAFYGVGNYEQAVAHSARALSHLGIRYPTTPWGVRRSTVRYLTAHFSRRLIAGFRKASPLRHTMDVATAQEISTTCRSLAWLDFFADEERLGLDSLIELDAGERSGDDLARVRGLSSLAIVLSMFRAFALARRRAAEATSIAQNSNNASLIAMAALARGWLEFGTGPLDQCRESFEQSAAAFRGIGGIRGWGAPNFFLFWVHYWQANLSASARTAAELIEVGDGAGDPHVSCWGQTGMGLVRLATGPLDEAAAHLSKARDLGIESTSFRMQAVAIGMLGKCCLRRGRLGEASANLEKSVSLIESKGLRSIWSPDTFNGIAGLWLTRADRLQGTRRRQALREARRWCRRALPSTHDGLLSETQRLLGTMAWLAGEPKKANDLWNRRGGHACRAGTHPARDGRSDQRHRPDRGGPNCIRGHWR